ncbi:MAG: hypothetical protein NDJ19_00600 [Ramlibacter sp.]|nr:hypothetical protein [Ramlibacter sp.]
MQTPAVNPAGSPAAAQKNDPVYSLPFREKFFDFVEGTSLEVSPRVQSGLAAYAPPYGAIVGLHIRAGSLSMQHDMRADQARALGQFLLRCADACDWLEPHPSAGRGDE